VVVEAAPSVLLGGCDQSSFDGVSVDVSDHFGPGRFVMDVRVKVSVLPELRASAAQFAGSDLLECLQKLRQQNQWRLPDYQVGISKWICSGIRT
jgi:hypothetical protein